jgi:predicted alpha/beta-fold hydrolase
MKDQRPKRTPEELAKLRERQRKQQENIDWLNAQAPRPPTWTIGKELGGAWLAAGLVKAMAKHGPRKETQ